MSRFILLFIHLYEKIAFFPKFCVFVLAILPIIFFNSILCKQKRQVCDLPFANIAFLLLACSLESSLELVKTSACVNELLLSCEERMALGANFNSDLAALGGLGCNYLAASATDNALVVIRMDSGFHNTFYLVSNIRCSLTSFANAVIISYFFYNCNSFFKNFLIFIFR